MIFHRQFSLLFGLITITVLGSGLSAKSEPAPVPGTTTTKANALTAGLVEPVSEISAPKVAQSDSNTNPSPGSVETTPTPDSTPATETPAPTVSLSDVDSSYWAYPFIQGLAARNVIAGFPDGTFRPEQPVTRAQFAAMIQKAFTQTQSVRQLPPGGFTDVPANYWAAPAIQSAYETGFLSGYPNNTFLPNQGIAKVEAITSLTSGLGLTASGSATDVVNTNYTDAAQLPDYGLNPVAAATQANLVVNYPDVRTLNPQSPLTRAEAAAHLYQALVKLGQVQPIPSNVAAANYIVGGPGGVAQNTTPPTTPSTPPTNETPTTTAATPIGITDYVGAAANIGAIGDTALGDTNFTVFSKFKLLRSFPLSLRPAVVIGDDTTVLVPVTLDFPLGRPVNVDLFNRRFPLFPYIGGGVVITTDSGDVGPLVTAGFDYRLSPQFTATAGVNVGWVSGDPQLGVLLGVAYNFNLFGGF